MLFFRRETKPFDRVASPESVSIPLKKILYKLSEELRYLLRRVREIRIGNAAGYVLQ